MITPDDLGIATDYGLLDNQVRIVTQTMKSCKIFARENSPLIDFVLARLSSGHRSGAIWVVVANLESSLTAT